MNFQETLILLDQLKKDYFIPPYRDYFAGVSIVPFRYIEACYRIKSHKSLDDFCFLISLKKNPEIGLRGEYNSTPIYYTLSHRCIGT